MVEKLSQEFLNKCPVENGFRMRGLAMTRTEVFVDAAFAFAVTMLVISFDAIPRTYEEMVAAIRTIPAFVAAVAQLIWLWHTHTLWCRRYGLDNNQTVWLSALLLVIMLIYIYPMRVLLEGFFAWISDGFFSTAFRLSSYEELRFLFVFMATTFAALCLTFVLMHRYALRLREPLRLNAFEENKTVALMRIWGGIAVISLLLALVSVLVPENWVPHTGFLMFLIGVWIPLVEFHHDKIAKSLKGAS